MEITTLPKGALKIKGKHATLAINPQDRSTYNGIIALGKSPEEISNQEDTVIINGPGEYEVGGIKITGLRNEGDTIYSFIVDRVEILLGQLKSLEKMQHKLKEHNVVVAIADSVVNPEFATSLASNVLIFSGEKAQEIINNFGKDSLQTMPKYTTTVDKLPQEMQTILLQ